MKKGLIPVEVSRTKLLDGKEKVTTGMSLKHFLSGKPNIINIEEKLSLFTEAYTGVLNKCNEILKKVDKERKEKGRSSPI